VKDGFLFRTTKILQVILGLYMFFLIAVTIMERTKTGTGLTQMIDWELRNRFIMGIIFVIPFMRLKREFQAIYLVILFVLVSIFFTSMLFLPGRADLYPIAIIVTAIAYINIFFIARQRIAGMKLKR